MTGARNRWVSLSACAYGLTLLWCGVAQGAVPLVTIEAPEESTWVGQRTPFTVELRSKGPFVGAAGFSLPQLKRCVIIKIGNPVVATKELEGETWFVQSHEFALFSQAAGRVDMLAFQVRFSSRNDFTSPPEDHVEQAPAQSFEVKRPPGSDKIGLLVTTEELDIKETWDPQPGATKQGALFHRTITQSAGQMTGMALAPPPTEAPAGIRVYPGPPEVTDNTERGEFTGFRSDTITYLMEQPGSFTLPAIEYVWWNPKTEELSTKTLPAVTFEVAALPTHETSATPAAKSRRWGIWLGLTAAIVGLMFWQRRNIFGGLQTIHARLNPPDRVAARKLLRACRHNDAQAAETAWLAWQNTQSVKFAPSAELRESAVDLQRHLYGPTPTSEWAGDQLEKSFREQLASRRSNSVEKENPLPPLNA